MLSETIVPRRSPRRGPGLLPLLLLLPACTTPAPDEQPDLGADLREAAPDLAPPEDLSPPPPGACLAPDRYAAELRIDAALPLGVTRRYTTPRRLRGARWGRHGGPLLTDEVMRDGAARPQVTRFTLPVGPTGELSARDLPVTEAASLPDPLFYNAMVDLPFSDLAILGYTGRGANFPGEVLLYARDYDAVRGRAHVNGIYDAIGVGAGRILYTGLSGLSAGPISTGDNGLWASDLCGGALAPTGGCPPSRRLVAWDGYSGPIARDGAGNVLVAASLAAMAGGPTDEIYGLTRAAAEGKGAVAPATLLSLMTQGTSVIAAAAPAAGQPGWVLHKGYDAPMKPAPITAQAYEEAGDRLAPRGAALPRALTVGTDATGLSLIGGGGALWVIASTAQGSVLLALGACP